MSINKLLQIAILASAFVWLSNATALDHPSPFSNGVEEQSKGERATVVGESFLGGRLAWGANLGLSLGGDKFENSDLSNVDPKLKNINLDVRTQAGGRVILGGIMRYEFFDMPVEARLGFAFQSDGLIPAEDVTFKRFPLDLMAFYKLGKHRFGGGITLHLSPKLDIELKKTDDYSQKLDNATGLILQYDYFFLHDVSASMRFVSIDYEHGEELNINGDHFATMVQIYF